MPKDSTKVFQNLNSNAKPWQFYQFQYFRNKAQILISVTYLAESRNKKILHLHFIKEKKHEENFFIVDRLD